MRFRTSHKVVSYLVAGLGMLALALGGILHPALIALASIATVASWWVEEPMVSKPLWSKGWTAGLVLILVVQIVRMIFGASLIECGIEFALLLQISRLFNRRGAREYQQIVVLSLVNLIAASVLDQDFSFALLYAGFVIALPWALCLSHLRREIEGNYRRSEPEAQRAHVNRILNSKRIISPKFLWVTALLALPIFLMSGLLFIFFPRVGLGFLAGGTRQRITVAGFSDTVQLGDMGVVREDQTVVMRVEMEPLRSPPPPRLGVHWRGAAYDHYDGRRWTRSEQLDQRELVDRLGNRYCLGRSCRVRGPARVYSIYLEDLDPPVLLMPPAPTAVLMTAQRRGAWLFHRRLFQSPMQEVRRQEEPALVIHYQVETPLNPPEAFYAVRLRDPSPYLQLPSLDPRVAELTREVTAGAGDDPRRIAEVIMDHLEENYRYSLDLRGASDEQPLEDFLFRRRSGHCEFFSTAMVVMLRQAGVPARNVTGFLGGRLNPYGNDGAYYVVTQSDAHSWVEYYVEGSGWIAADPTPPATGGRARERTIFSVLQELLDASQLAWEKNIVAYDLENQVDMLTTAYFATRRWRRSWRQQQEQEEQQQGSGLPAPRWTTAAWIGGPVAALLGGLLVGWLLRRRRKGLKWRARRRPAQLVQAESLLRRLDQALVRRGVPRPSSRTPREHARVLREQAIDGSDLVEQVVNRYNEVRFGGREFLAGELSQLQATIRQIGQRT